MPRFPLETGASKLAQRGGFSAKTSSMQPGSSDRTRSWRRRLANPIDASSLAAFRIVFGPLVAYEMWYKLASNKLVELYQPEFHFKYLYFGWVPAPSAWQAELLIQISIGLGLLISVGFLFRLTALLLAISLSYYFLVEQTLFINHIYLYCLLAWLLTFTRANAKWSVDSWLARRTRVFSRTLASEVVPYWNVWLLRFQMAVVYVYAGLAKLGTDWLSGRALGLGLRARLETPWLPIDVLSLALSWGGALFDLAVVPLLLWQRTRLAAFGLACAFHITNASIFGLASFPWMSIALTSLFLPPQWPLQISDRLGLRALPVHTRPLEPSIRTAMLSPLATFFLGAYLLLQVLFPTRPWWYPGDASWTEEGHRFSWHMMLRGKHGRVRFFLQYPGEQHRTPVDVRPYLTPRQASRMSGDPDCIHQLARFLAQRHARTDGTRPRVFVHAETSLNGWPRKPLIDPDVDLSTQPRGLAPASWILRD